MHFIFNLWINCVRLVHWLVMIRVFWTRIPHFTYKYIHLVQSSCFFFLSGFFNVGSSQQNALVYMNVRLLEAQGHVIITNSEGKRKPCAYCLSHNIKTKSGKKAYTRHRCSLCNTSLCTKNRPCFYMHHRYLLSSSWYF